MLRCKPCPQVTSATPSFEEVALRLMETGEPEAVAAFLQTRLDTLGREDKAQVGRPYGSLSTPVVATQVPVLQYFCC